MQYSREAKDGASGLQLNNPPALAADRVFLSLAEVVPRQLFAVVPMIQTLDYKNTLNKPKHI